MPKFDSVSARKRLFIGGLLYTVTREELVEFFAEIGPVVKSYLAPDHERSTTGAPRNRGFGFVEYGSELEAEAAVRQFNNQPGPGGRKIGVKFSEE